jgi:uncharacterized protein (TIGR02145 family)
LRIEDSGTIFPHTGFRAVTPSTFACAEDTMKLRTLLPLVFLPFFFSHAQNHIFGTPGSAAFDADRNQVVTDYDGNVYSMVTIGTQTWLKENLKVAHYRNGEPVPEVTSSSEWVDLKTGARCYFDNDSANGTEYGSLYNWHAVNDSRGLAPAGWHIPDDAEWKTLEIFLGMSQAEADRTDWRGTDQGAKLKETDTLHWRWPTGNVATNESGFTALGGGWRIYFSNAGSFFNLTNTGQWWTSSEKDAATAWLRNLCVYHPEVYRIAFGKTQGCSVRCIRDAPTGVDESTDDIDFFIYPNPASDRVLITRAGMQNSRIQVYSAIGVCLFQTDVRSGIQELNIGAMPRGIYFVRISGTHRAMWKKMIKR